MTLTCTARQMSTAEFNKFRDLIYKECRIALRPHKKMLVMNRLAKRLRELGFNTYTEYFDYVTSTQGRQEELARMVDAITTNTTQFFRESKQFEFLDQYLWPQLLQVNSVQLSIPIKIWSSACSTGEEPYTIGISASEFFSRSPGRTVVILASDISDTALSTARAGIYPEDKVSGIPLTLLHKYFLKGNERVKVKPELQRLVKFDKINLNDSFHRRLKDFDIVFCRNVIIYFDRQTQEELMLKYYEVLRPGGYLFLGHSETLHGMATDFQFIMASVYRKPTGAEICGAKTGEPYGVR
ncbi:MAG: protein-glutamate O-methyltransferase [bacterium]